MRRLKYGWDADVYIIHIDLLNQGVSAATYKYSRLKAEAQSCQDGEGVLLPQEFRRVMLSKKSVSEEAVVFELDEGVDLRVYKLLDRAYLPTEADRAFLEVLA